MTNELEELQVKVAFLEDTLSKLGDEFYLQQKDLLVLRAQHARLMNKLGNLDSQSDSVEILDESPPHY